MITYEEYKKKALSLFAKYKDFDEKYMQELIKRDCIKKAYDEECELAKMRNSVVINPDGLVYGCHMLYPDFPY